MSISDNQYQNHLQQLTRLLSAGSHSYAAPLADHCSWQIGGPADLLVKPDNVDQVAIIMSFVERHGLPLVVIGQGTNLLFDDAGLRGVVMKIGDNLAKLEIEDNRILAQGGVWIPRLARRAMQAGLAGLEHTVGIPGTLGGLIVMNGGSRRQGIGDHVSQVRTVDRQGNKQLLSRAECRFGYRQSALQGTGCVVVQVELECPSGDLRQIRRDMLDDLRERRGKFPRKLANCGSVFLSTSEMHATVGPPGRVIEEAGLKGHRSGRAEVSPQHANFIINRGGARSADVLALIAEVRETVRARIGFDLRCEVRYVSPQGQIVPADQVV